MIKNFLLFLLLTLTSSLALATSSIDQWSFTNKVDGFGAKQVMLIGTPKESLFMVALRFECDKYYIIFTSHDAIPSEPKVFKVIIDGKELKKQLRVAQMNKQLKVGFANSFFTDTLTKSLLSAKAVTIGLEQNFGDFMFDIDLEQFKSNYTSFSHACSS